MRKIKGYLDEWRIQEYLLIAFFISWLSWGILILLTALNIISFQSAIGMILFVIGGFGPTISAILCMDGKLSWKKVSKFIFNREKHTWWYLILFMVLLALVTGASSMETNPDMAWYSLPLVWVFCSLVGGGNEELGWRGTLQPLLSCTLRERVKNPFIRFSLVSLIVGVIWAVWHLPLWFVSGSTQQGMSFVWFALSAVLLSFWLGCIYIKTSSVFYCMLFHGFTNLINSFFIIKINWLIIIGYIAVTVLAIIISSQSKQFSRREKRTDGIS